jgi:hypothetical protein
MAVDIEQAGAVVLLMDNVVVPDLVVKRARFHGVIPVVEINEEAMASARRAGDRRSAKRLQRGREPAEKTARQARMVLQHDAARMGSLRGHSHSNIATKLPFDKAQDRSRQVGWTAGQGGR